MATSRVLPWVGVPRKGQPEADIYLSIGELTRPTAQPRCLFLYKQVENMVETCSMDYLAGERVCSVGSGTNLSGIDNTLPVQF